MEISVILKILSSPTQSLKRAATSLAHSNKGRMLSGVRAGRASVDTRLADGGTEGCPGDSRMVGVGLGSTALGMVSSSDPPTRLASKEPNAMEGREELVDCLVIRPRDGGREAEGRFGVVTSVGIGFFNRAGFARGEPRKLSELSEAFGSVGYFVTGGAGLILSDPKEESRRFRPFTVA